MSVKEEIRGQIIGALSGAKFPDSVTRGAPGGLSTGRCNKV